MAFQDRLTELRRERELSQETLSEIISVSPKTVSRWESGKSDPTLRDLYALSAALCVPVEELIQDKEEPQAAERETPKPKDSYEKFIEYMKEEKERSTERKSLTLIISLVALGVLFAIISIFGFVDYYRNNQPPIDGEIVVWQENTGIFSWPELFLWFAVLFLLIGAIVLFVNLKKRGGKNETR